MFQSEEPGVQQTLFCSEYTREACVVHRNQTSHKFLASPLHLHIANVYAPAVATGLMRQPPEEVAPDEFKYHPVGRLVVAMGLLIPLHLHGAHQYQYMIRALVTILVHSKSPA